MIINLTIWNPKNVKIWKSDNNCRIKNSNKFKQKQLKNSIN